MELFGVGHEKRPGIVSVYAQVAEQSCPRGNPFYWVAGIIGDELPDLGK
jgi:hypothetical protein